MKYNFPHLKHRLFDPQLYYAGLDPAESREYCATLASYPWFGVSGLAEYHSSTQIQAEWRKDALERINDVWTSAPPTDVNVIAGAVRDCIEFQRRLGCWAIILPSPLTSNPGSDYAMELTWLDSALDYIRSKEQLNAPVFATIAITDTCVRNIDPHDNRLLGVILDTVSARKIDGVYIVLEQGSETSEERNCGNTRALRSILHMVYLFAKDCHLRVGVNFLGPFGLVCEAVGAEWWASGWYKSMYRLRLADKIGTGRAFPSYWSYSTAADIHLDYDFDKITATGLLNRIADKTSASSVLLAAADRSIPVRNVPSWEYRQSNVEAAQEHFLLSAINAERTHAKYSGVARLNFVGKWLEQAMKNANDVGRVLGLGAKTKMQHVQAWRDAFIAFRRDHRC